MSTKDLAYPITVSPSSYSNGAFCYIAEHPDLPGCVAYGDSLPEAKSNLELARQAYIEHMQATGDSVPPPSERASTEWTADFTDAPEELAHA